MGTKSKFLSIAVTAVLASSAFAGVASAGHGDPGEQPNSHGMCTAYFSGSENGQSNKRDKGTAFGNFEEYVGDYDDDDDVDAYDIAAWCNDYTGGYGNPGQGNDAFFPEDATQSDDDTCGTDHDQPCDYEGGDGTGTGGNGNGNGKTRG